MVRQVQASWVNSYKIQSSEAAHCRREWPSLSKVQGRKPPPTGVSHNEFFSRQTCPDRGFLTGGRFVSLKKEKRSQHSPCKEPGQQLLRTPAVAKGRCPPGQQQPPWSPCSSLLCPQRASLQSSPAGARPLLDRIHGLNGMFLLSLRSFRVQGEKAPTSTTLKCQNKILPQQNRLCCGWLKEMTKPCQNTGRR